MLPGGETHVEGTNSQHQIASPVSEVSGKWILQPQSLPLLIPCEAQDSCFIIDH
jgi:hypothetical protein